MESSGNATGYAAIQDYLFGLKAGGLKFGVDRMRVLAKALGHPERHYPVLHIAGTNGKGSVAAMLDAILHAAGWRTGLYTSPHLVKLGERVQVNRQLLTDDEIISFARQLRPVAERRDLFEADDHPSFFEFMTAMAFLQFARARVDMAVVEVGLGGRLDATNVVLPEVAAITSIALDHCEMLGDRIELIAAEKAGIIKPGRPVVIGRVPPEAEAVIRAIAAERQAPVTAVRDVFGDDVSRYPHTNLAGDYQRWNAATATLVARLLPVRWGLTDAVIDLGLAHTHWPGRWQRVTVGGRPLILDASHNPEGAQVLDANLTALRTAMGRKPIVVTGALGEQRARALLEVVAKHAAEIHLAVPHQARACGFESLEHCLPREFAGKILRTTVEAVFPGPDQCTVGGPDDTVVVTGSIYLLGEVFERLEPGRGAGEGRLQDF
jgi:dihydrofolate synthase / folylpolyglutamate synthase